MHSFATGSASMSCNHCAVRHLVKFNAKIIEPFDYRWSLVYQCVYKFRLTVKMTATKSVKVMLCRRIIRLVCSLNATFCHHCVCIAYAQFCNQKNFCTSFACHDGCRTTGTASANYKNVSFVTSMSQVNFFRFNARLSLKHFCKFKRSFLSLVWTDFKFCKLFFNAVRMKFQQQVSFFICCKSGMFKFDIFFTFFSYDFCSIVQVVTIHSYILLDRGCLKSKVHRSF